MFWIEGFLLLSVVVGLEALTQKQRFDNLEEKLENVLNKTEKGMMDLEDKILQISRCELQLCNLTRGNESNGDNISISELVFHMSNVNRTITEEIKKVYAYVEKNSHALVDEFQNTLTVLMNQHKNINQKIRFNARNVRKLEGKYHRSLDNENYDIKRFEHKISVLDKDLEKLLKTVTRQGEHIDNVGKHLLKLDRRDDDFSENIERNYLGVSGLDHNLVEIEQRYREFALDLDKFKDNTRKGIEEIKAKLNIDQSDKKKSKSNKKAKSCEDGWSQHESKCYTSIDVGVDWKTAVLMCGDLNAKLAEPDTKEEMDYVRRSFQGWIGASDKGINGTFLWESSEKAVDFFKSRSEIPSNPHSYQYCAYISRKKINVERCSIRFHYICETEIL